jgi:O-glycosyl hydrolase
VINKQLSTTSTATINLSTFAHRGTTQVWQLTSTNVINRLSDLSVSGTSFAATLPAQSITLFVVPKNGIAPGSPTNLRVIK